MVGPGGSATIVYASNCSVRVPSGVWAVQASVPCAVRSNVIDFSTRMNQEAPPPADAAAEPGADGTTPLIIGGVVVAGAVGAAILFSQGGNNETPPQPASP